MGSPVDNNDRPLLLLVASSYAVYRSYILDAMAKGYDLWLLNPVPATWEEPYIVGHTVVDCLDLDKLVTAAEEVAADREIAGVLSYDEVYVETAAQLCAALGLGSVDLASVAACRDKSTTRERMRAAGLPQPASRPVSTLAQAEAFAAEIGYPVILKPRNLGGSLGIRKVERAEDLTAAFELTDGVRMQGIRQFEDYVIVEEFVEGEEVSFDCVVRDGVCTPMIVGRKVLGEGRLRFEEIGHDVDANDPLLDDPRVRDLLSRAHEAIGFTNGFTHIEFKLGPGGIPDGMHCIEVNARLGGGMIPYLGLLTSGTNAPLAAAAVATGRPPVVEYPEPLKAASVRFGYPPYDMTVTSARTRDELLAPPIREMRIGVQPGQAVRLPPHSLARSGYVIAVADTLAESRAAVADSARFFEFTGEPL